MKYEVIQTYVQFKNRGEYEKYNPKSNLQEYYLNGKYHACQHTRIYKCDSLDIARKNGYRKVISYSTIASYAVATVYKVQDGKRVKVGEVYWDINYMDHRFKGVMWVPVGAGESDWVHGVVSDGTLNDQKYKLT